MNHVDEKILELYVLGSDAVKDQRRGIEQHVQECPGCGDLLREIKEYYNEVGSIREERANNTEHALARRDKVIPFHSFMDRPAEQYEKPPLPIRVARFIVRHPVSTSLGLAAALVGLVMLLLPKEIEKDLNPAYARAKDEFLVAYNKAGEELWRKHVGVGFDIYLAKWPLNRRAIFTADTDQDGKNEIYCIYGEIPGNPNLNAVFCYNADGSERWKYQFHANIQFGGEDFSDTYYFNSILADDFDRDGVVEVIAEAEHSQSFPNVVLRLDGRNGTLLGEYWHAGNIEFMAHKDIDHDGVKEIFLTNRSSLYGAAPVVVLDPRHMNGYAPVPSDRAPKGLSPGTEKYYILLPRTGLETSKDFLSSASEAVYFKNDSTIEVIAYDRLKDGNSFAVHYYFDSAMQCVKIFISEPNRLLYRRLRKEGVPLKELNEKYIEDLKSGMNYWNGEMFVNKPSMNARYTALLQNLP
jgi:hypothetical protein